jgi:hypothetical protein
MPADELTHLTRPAAGEPEVSVVVAPVGTPSRSALPIAASETLRDAIRVGLETGSVGRETAA